MSKPYKVGDTVTVVPGKVHGTNGIPGEFPFTGEVDAVGTDTRTGEPWYRVDGWFVEYDMVEEN